MFLNNRIKVLNMIGSFASLATASMAAKNGPKKLSQRLKTDFDVKGS